MNFSISISKQKIDRALLWVNGLNLVWVVAGLAIFLAIVATMYSFSHGYIVAYGDAESHLNIAKRVVDNLTPGFAQLGGIWLPLPHVLLIPFVFFNPLWRSGLAGSIVSGVCFVVSAIYIYRFMLLIGGDKWAGFVAAVVFMTNPNILYLQTTPMTELTLVVFFILSSYYFVQFLEAPKNVLALLMAAFFGFCATLSRYDGWGLVLMEAGIVVLMYIPWKKIPRRFSEIKSLWDPSMFKLLEGRLVLFCTLAFFGIGLWLAWGWLILGDALYFTHSVFSAKSQQASWLARGELPAYHNAWQAFLYFFVTSMSNVGVILFLVCLLGVCYYLFSNSDKKRWFIFLLLLVPFIFNTATLWLGQSVIFIPDLHQSGFDWQLFNVRYGVMMVPMAAVLVAYLFYKVRWPGRLLIVVLAVAQIGLYVVGYSQIITLQDGLAGLSSEVSKLPDAQGWMAKNYDHGLVLEDDFARTISLIRTPIPMHDFIYVGNKPYWDDSLKAPEKYATWIVMQKNDSLWTALYDNQAMQGRLYKYFVKQYTSPDILIFKRNPAVPEQE